MEIPVHRRWMINRLLPSRGGYTQEFLDGVEEFVEFAKSQSVYLEENKIKCPCASCQNTKFLTPNEVKLHLLQKGFMWEYWYWTSHGENEPLRDRVNIQNGSCSMMQIDSVVSHISHHHTLLEDDINSEQDTNTKQPPNVSAQSFFDALHSLQQPLWDGCLNHTELSATLRLMSIKSDFHMQRDCFDQITSFMEDSYPQNNHIPKNFFEAKEVVEKIGLSTIEIDCCPRGCMLYYKDDETLDKCKFCGHPRRKVKKSSKGSSKEVSYARMHYFPLIPRLQRLYASRSSAKHMTWHYESTRKSDDLCHPSDGEAWKHFDNTYPDFAFEPRNVRLAICADGFAPYSLSAKSYSCWPVIVTPYNLPPEMCMTMPFMFLSCIIPGPENSTNKIDIYLQPLIDELKTLWEEGVQTYDISRQENFQMRAAVMWTINDFTAYGMLSGWSTLGNMSCPICMSDINSFCLRYGGKSTWFDCHRRFLPPNHPFRRDKDSFLRNKIEKRSPPVRLTGYELSEIVSDLPRISQCPSCEVPGFREIHNWTKQSIFWELPYWKTHLLRHNLDVMHIEKNFLNNILNTVMDVKEKTKDNVNARKDMEIYCKRKELELKQLGNGYFSKPKAKFVLSRDKKREVCTWLKELRMPDGYASNIANCVDLRRSELTNMKGHDCHVFLETLLPIAFSALPDEVLKPLVELSQFFKNLCATILQVDKLKKMEENIAVILCKLERIFPPGFFDCMEHLPIHLAYEARVGGPVQYRWMYPFERFLGKLKKEVKNKACVEESICEAYLCQEAAYFSSFFFDSIRPTTRTQSRVNEIYVRQYELPKTLSVFRLKGRPAGKQKERYLNDKEYEAIHLHILLNCLELEPYIRVFSKEKRSQFPNASDAEIDCMIAREFPGWFKDNVKHLQFHNDEQHKYLCQVAWGPLRSVKTWSIYFVNGYKFHTEDQNEVKKTYNCGVCVKGVGEGEIENYYYGILKDVIEVEYLGEPIKRCVLFSCDWFDRKLNRGVRLNKHCELVEVCRSGRYEHYEPFVFADCASQVYYMSYPGNLSDKVDWLVAMPTKPRAKINHQHFLEAAYQEQQMNNIHSVHEDLHLELLRDDEGQPDEVNEESPLREVLEEEEEIEYEMLSEGDNEDSDIEGVIVSVEKIEIVIPEEHEDSDSEEEEEYSDEDDD